MRKIRVVNPSDRSWTRHRYLLWFGSVGTTYLLIYGNGLDDVLESAGEWLAAHAPGHIMKHDSKELRDLTREAREERGIDFPAGFNELGDDARGEIRETVESDLTYTESGYLTSYMWGIVAEDPSKADLIDFAAV